MPGLFDSVTPFLSGLRGGVLGSIGSGLANAQNAGAIDQALGPGQGQLMLSNPGASAMLNQRQIMEQTYRALLPQFGPQGAAIAAMHPEELAKMTMPQKLGPAEHLEAPVSLFGLGGQPTSQQQGPPSSQPGPSNASVGGGGYMGPQNNAGLMDQPSLMAMVERRLKGDTEVNAELSGGMSGLNVINKGNFQKLLSTTMQQRGISGGDLARIDAKFPAYKKAQQDLGDMQARMGTAQIEFGQIWPKFLEAVQKWQSQFPSGMTQFPSGNAFLQFLSKHSGDPSVAPLQQYVTTLRNVYGRAISTNPRGPTDSDKAHFDAGVNTHWNMGQFGELGNALGNEMSAAQQSIPMQRNVTDVEYGFGKDADPVTLQQAKTAIAAGADRQKVIHRLKEHGFTDKGL